MGRWRDLERMIVRTAVHDVMWAAGVVVAAVGTVAAIRRFARQPIRRP